VDNVQKDNSSSTLYEWFLHMPLDVKLDSSELNQAIFSDQEGRRLLVYAFHNTPSQVNRLPQFEMLAGYGMHPSRRKHCPRLSMPYVGKELASKVIVFPLTKGEELPKITWDMKSRELTVDIAGQVDTLKFSTCSSGAETFSIISKDDTFSYGEIK
jgi:hypothetical protein